MAYRKSSRRSSYKGGRSSYSRRPNRRRTTRRTNGRRGTSSTVRLVIEQVPVNALQRPELQGQKETPVKKRRF